MFTSGVDINAGYLRIHIASNGKEYRQYMHRGPRERWSSKAIEPGQSLNSKIVILDNEKPQVSHLNVDAAKQVSDGKIITDFAFPEPGIYSIKAVLIIPGEGSKTVESLPIRIEMKEPDGFDLNIWTAVKNNPEIAYFMRENLIATWKEEERSALLDKIERVLADNPSGILADQIRQSLEKYRVSEKRRQELKELRKKTKGSEL